MSMNHTAFAEICASASESREESVQDREGVDGLSRVCVVDLYAVEQLQHVISSI